MRPTASPDKLSRISIVKEWAQNHSEAVLLDALLRKENIMAHLFPLSHTAFGDCGIPIRLPTVLARKRSPSPPPIDKGKKPHKDNAKVDSSLEPPP